MERICITGGQGRLAHSIAGAFSALGDAVEAPGRDQLDVSSTPSVDAYFAQRPAPDLLVLQAGEAQHTLLARTSITNWDETFEVNLHGAFRCARAVARSMIRARRGHLILLSSHAVAHPAPGQAAYSASKAALHGLALSLAREWGPAQIRVNVILPGFMDTPMTSGVSPDHREAVLSHHTLGRLNTPEVVADFLVHLHRHLPHTSGQLFQLDSRPG
ncbi:3-oxoacyl-[acyl-carrier protein] reductase [Haloferula luteola]|uniref:3-oxoacyl-[acyl-carrier protein] reductase n=1 Tax=Haloferula luteola TaxID=595692 RepID=A0A840V060_9BACT|nr:SDR family oxidoreductase [Haloferula luteola]MBB5351402.1 3-oxoacyl-[acyl-carrier protein] reductase [Haloferula luteola]